MKVTSHITSAKKTIFSFEIIPPLRGHSILDIFNTLYTLMEFSPPFVNVTSHRQNRLTGTICAVIMHKSEVYAIPHFICGVFTKQMTEYALRKLNFLGGYNILILSGDTNTEKCVHSIELVKQIVALNKGLYKYLKTYDFCIGVAGYPEKHLEAPNMEEDIFRLYEKIKAGAYYVITQMFFDNNQYFELIEKMRFAGLEVTIIPGIKTISSKDQLKSIPSNFHVKIPTNLVKQITKYKKDIFHIGIEWTIQQSIELKQAGIPVIHYYTMSKPDNIYKIVIELIDE